MSASRRRPSLLPLTAVLLVASEPRCSSSPTTQLPPPASMTFTPTLATPPAGSITLSARAPGVSTITLDVVATDVGNLAGVYFDLVFNRALVQFTGGSAGPFLASSGGSVAFAQPADLAAANAAGRIPIGVAIDPATTGVSGTGVVCTLSLSAVAAGTSGLSFEAFGATTPFPVTNIPGIAFSGGAVTVVK